ncbi:MAG: hypothetical protein ACLVLH_07325 [Eisenbergiella massiliensis]
MVWSKDFHGSVDATSLQMCWLHPEGIDQMSVPRRFSNPLTSNNGSMALLPTAY